MGRKRNVPHIQQFFKATMTVSESVFSLAARRMTSTESPQSDATRPTCLDLGVSHWNFATASMSVYLGSGCFSTKKSGQMDMQKQGITLAMPIPPMRGSKASAYECNNASEVSIVGCIRYEPV